MAVPHLVYLWLLCHATLTQPSPRHCLTQTTHRSIGTVSLHRSAIRARCCRTVARHHPRKRKSDARATNVVAKRARPPRIPCGVTCCLVPSARCTDRISASVLCFSRTNKNLTPRVCRGENPKPCHDKLPHIQSPVSLLGTTVLNTLPTGNLCSQFFHWATNWSKQSQFPARLNYFLSQLQPVSWVELFSRSLSFPAV